MPRTRMQKTFHTAAHVGKYALLPRTPSQYRHTRQGRRLHSRTRTPLRKTRNNVRWIYGKVYDMNDNRTIKEFHTTRESGSGCPETDGGPHYYAFLDDNGRSCIDCGAKENK